jgi:glutamate dehydrogenase (NADP+)
MSDIYSTKAFIEKLQQSYADQAEFLQAAEEVSRSVKPLINNNDHIHQAKVMQRLAEPDRIISFRVAWKDDQGQIQINRGWRVQQSNLLGPYKGGLRFHPGVTESVLKFLAFEQCFKNALTGLPMGGGKGGADFDPKGRTDHEIMAFCQAFMLELHRHIGPQTDVPAGDINVGAKEIGYLYGQYKKINNQFGGSLTGKGITFGGSEVRTEATGFGVIYFLQQVLKQQGKELNNKKVCISGAGNVATFAAKKAIELEAKVISLSNSRGVLHVQDGLADEDIQWLLDNKIKHQNVLEAFATQQRGEWLVGQKPWSLKCDIAIPAATQNELDETDAQSLIQSGCEIVIEGANMPCSAGALKILLQNDCTYVPGKASNAGGVAVSGFEMSQNASFENKQFDEIDQMLQKVMQHIHQQCVEYGQQENSKIHYQDGANRAGFMRLATAMLAQGV